MIGVRTIANIFVLMAVRAGAWPPDRPMARLKQTGRLQPSAKAKLLSARWFLHIAGNVFGAHARCVGPKSASLSAL
jgi:hypothetical protein